MKYKQALVIGRFGPLCLNHIDLFNQAREYGTNLLVAKGIPNYERAAEFMTIEKLIEYKLTNLLPNKRTNEILESNVECQTVQVQDIFDKVNYANHVITQFEQAGLTLENTVLVGENQWTIDCFKDVMEIVPAKNNTGFHATDIRRELYRKGHSDLVCQGYTQMELKQFALAQHILDANGEAKTRLLTEYNFLFGGQ